MLNLRPAKPADLPRILEMTACVSAHEGHPPPAVTLETLTQYAFNERLIEIIAAESEDQLVGHIITTRSFDVQLGTPMRSIVDLYVQPAFRRRGVARRLMAAVAQRALDEGAGSVQWMMASRNREAEEFYRSIGARHDVGITMYLLADDIRALAKGSEPGESGIR